MVKKIKKIVKLGNGRKCPKGCNHSSDPEFQRGCTIFLDRTDGRIFEQCTVCGRIYILDKNHLFPSARKKYAHFMS